MSVCGKHRISVQRVRFGCGRTVADAKFFVVFASDFPDQKVTLRIDSSFLRIPARGACLSSFMCRYVTAIVTGFPRNALLLQTLYEKKQRNAVLSPQHETHRARSRRLLRH
jgi:hypothetical protein